MYEDISIDRIRILLRRAAWRIQYKTRTLQQKECTMIFENQAHDNGFEDEILSKFYVLELLDSIPSERCRFIIKRTIIDGMTEKEVAKELNITQQGVSKWKKKGLELLHQILMDSNK